MKIKIHNDECYGTFSKEKVTIRTFNLIGVKRYTKKGYDADDTNESIYELTNEEYAKFFEEYYKISEQKEPVCDICNGVEFDKIYLHVMDIGNGHHEPSMAFCHKCWARDKKSMELARY